jgi:hypothetical protein
VQLVQTARQLGQGFDEALRVIREAQMGGQGMGPAPLAQQALQG